MILNFVLGRGKLLSPNWILTALASPDRSPRPAFLCGGLTRLCRCEGLDPKLQARLDETRSLDSYWSVIVCHCSSDRERPIDENKGT